LSSGYKNGPTVALIEVREHWGTSTTGKLSRLALTAFRRSTGCAAGAGTRPGIAGLIAASQLSSGR